MTNILAVSSNKIWRNDITGLRAVAVLPVLLFHAFPEIFPGGFYGVDVFFVISGYLISGIIFRDVLANSFSYSDFYIRRIRRIFPNLILLLVFVAVVGSFFLSAKEFEGLGRHIYSSAFFYQNFREALQKTLFPSRIEQNRSVRFFFTTSKNGVFLPSR